MLGSFHSPFLSVQNRRCRLPAVIDSLTVEREDVKRQFHAYWLYNTFFRYLRKIFRQASICSGDGLSTPLRA